MKLFHISQSENTDYDTYSDAVVCCNTPEEASRIHPGGNSEWPLKDESCWDWCQTPEQVTVKYIGEAAPEILFKVVCASYHAG
jgi:hypothetical protein